MLEEKLTNKINKLLKKESFVELPPTNVEPMSTPVVSITTLEEPKKEVEQGNIIDLINKQTEMILGMIREQNLVIQKLIDVLAQQKPQQINVSGNASDFKEKIVDIRFDEKGNPIGATIKIKEDYIEDNLDLEELENSKHLIIRDIEIPQ